MMDLSLSKAMAKRFVTEVCESEAVVRRAVSARASHAAPTKKGARKAISDLLHVFHHAFLDYITYDDDAVLRFCTVSNLPSRMPDDDETADIAMTMETIDVDPKKRLCTKLGVRVCFSMHSIRRVFQRLNFEVPLDASRLDYGKIVECLQDANIWCQTVLNAMRLGKVLSKTDDNVNLIIPTRHGAFVGTFSADMTLINVRSFLGPDQLGVRRDVWERCRDIMAETGMDLDWVSNTNFKDPKVVAAFVLAEEAGVFSINWNRTNTAKDTALDLQGAAERLRAHASYNKTIRKDQREDTYF